MIKRETIDQIRASSDIVQVVSSYMPLKHVGKYWRGLCPFHPDKSPSFYVSPERQVYHCFGCGAGGSTVNFVMQFEKVDFPEAVKLLAKRLNIDVQFERVNLKHQAAYEACEFAAQFFTRQFGKYSAAVNYLLRRGMKDETVKRFRLGYAPGGIALRTEAGKQGFSDEVLLKAGLIAERERGTSDYFFGRVVCPIMSVSGRVIGFSGRVLDDSEPKYLNTPDTEIFHKGEILFGLFQAKNYLRESVPILVEGNFDLLSLANRAINQVVAPLGTAFTFEQALLLKRYNSQVCVMFDADRAGQNAARRAIDVLLKAGIEPAIAELPVDYDPDDYIREFGPEKLVELTGQAGDLVSFMLRTRNPKSVAEKNVVLRELLQLIGLIPDGIARDLHLNRVSESFQVAKDLLRARVVQAEAAAAAEPAGGKPVRAATGTKMTREEKTLAMAAVKPAFARLAREMLPPEVFDDAVLREIASKIYELHEGEARSLAALVESLSEETQRRRVASWEFQALDEPTEEEYAERVAYDHSRWLLRQSRSASAQGNEVEDRRLETRYNELRHKASK